MSNREPITEASAIVLVHDAPASELLTLTLALHSEFRERGYAYGSELERVARFLANLIRGHKLEATQAVNRAFIGTRRAPWDAALPPD